MAFLDEKENQDHTDPLDPPDPLDIQDPRALAVTEGKGDKEPEILVQRATRENPDHLGHLQLLPSEMSPR